VTRPQTARTVGRWVRTATLVVGVPSLLIAAWFAARDVRDVDPATWWALVPALALSTTSLWLQARSWRVLLPAGTDATVADDAFFTSQLVKYSPVGGFAQAAAQAGLAIDGTTGAARATTAMAVSKLTMVVAAGCAGPVLAATNPALAPWLRLLLCCTPAGLALGHPAVLHRSLELAGRVLRRPLDPAVLPDPGAVWRSIGWAVPAQALAGASFAVLAVVTDPGVDPVQAAAGFVVAWAVGFLVIPVPAGLGVREAVIAVLVEGPPGTKLVAAVMLRLVVIAAEALLAAAVRVRSARRPAEPGASRPPGGPAGPTG
jgi:hypothetical protein